MRQILIILIVGAVLCGAAIFYISEYWVKMPGSFHYYRSLAVRIPSIKLEVIYFVPKDQIPDARFFEKIKSELARAQAFHIREFNGVNPLRYIIYSKPVLGEESSVFYDGDDTARGNPGVIKKLIAETGRRLYDPEGDLYDASFTRRGAGELPVRVFVYQGVGASSGVLSVVVSYDYFTRTQQASTVVYHELMHVVGVPDAYDYDTNATQSDDIMGAGREKPILETYIRGEIKNGLTD